MTPPRETPGQDAEVLAAGRPRRIGPLLAAVVVLALVGWLAVREDAPAPVSPRSAPPGLATSEPVPSEPAPSALDPSLDQLVFVDPVRAVAVRSDCTVSLGTTTCDRTLLVSDDAGTTFQDRGRLPVQAPYLLLADRAGAIALLDEALSRLVRTLDGGESWAETPVTQGPPAPIPAGVPALSGPVGDCTDRCGELVW
ncbi:MAG: hypothetical protein H0T85_01120, partial [Geodermatophilaceae bacterium]|nr:hypothetical protein [Geodermatophilaceae bacterium]